MWKTPFSCLQEAYRYGTIAAFYDCLAKEPNLFLFFQNLVLKQNAFLCISDTF